MIRHIAICNISPVLEGGRYPIKRTVGEEVTVEADILTDGVHCVNAHILYRKKGVSSWEAAPMSHFDNDRFKGSFTPREAGRYEYAVEAWSDPLRTWRNGVVKKIDAKSCTPLDLEPGIEKLRELAKNGKSTLYEEPLKRLEEAPLPSDLLQLIEKLQIPPSPKGYVGKDKVVRQKTPYEVEVKRERARFSSWYELFPRSSSPVTGRHGTFRDLIDRLPEIAELGFDILYLPPIHPIGVTHRKGKNNALTAKEGDPGSPWAIGSAEGGHKSIHKELGTLEEFKKLIAKAKSYGMEIALDIAFQCSPDHPYLKEHKEWFTWRSDGSIQYAENPPKKYEDIVPFNFDTSDKKGLYDELTSIITYWVEQGVKVFRIDNPHTKPFSLWSKIIEEVNAIDRDVIFLSEAFTRPKIMQQLALIGFDQSYSYFTWRTTKEEITDYIIELNSAPLKEYFRPNFWPNTPDILPYHLQGGERAAFIARLILAATLSPNYGIYGPAYEQCVSRAIEGKEEYRDSEKYEIKPLVSSATTTTIAPTIKRVNQIRKEQNALQRYGNVEFCDTKNDRLIGYIKYSDNKKPHLLIVVNLDFCAVQEGLVCLPLNNLNLPSDKPYTVTDLLTGNSYRWQGGENYVKLIPGDSSAHIFTITP